MMNQVTRLIGPFAVAVLTISLWSSPILAQSQRAGQKERQEKGYSQDISVRETSRIPPVSIINNPVPQYLSGEVNVTVRGNENPIIRLGLAQNGVTLVEFPVSDRFFAINPGNPDLVTVEDSPTKETDRFFVIRPGAGFAPALEGSKAITPATSIIVQMSSGMVVTFVLYPVRDIEQNAHRCVVTYDRGAIVSARRAAGLATNLDQRDASLPNRQRATSIRITPDSESSSQKQLPDQQGTAQSESIPKNAQPGRRERPRVADTENEDRSEKVAASRNFRFEDLFPKGKENFSDPIHGLKIVARIHAIFFKQRQIPEAMRIAIAVRNTLDVPLKIVPGHPELQVQTLDKKGRVLQVEPVKLLEVESSAPNGTIAPKQTAYYLLTYEASIIGAKQRLSVAVAQINAADEPVTMELTAGMR
jgi:hypothetical protein